MFQVANLPESMTDPADKRTDEWVEDALQKIEKQLTHMVLDGESPPQNQRTIPK